MKNKIISITTAVLIVITFVLFFAKSINEDSWLCTGKGWIEHGRPSSSKPVIPCGINEEHIVIEKYLNDNISNLSPQKEVLGGKFYITEINWLENASGTVEYEDGHIALKAVFSYEIKYDNNSMGYSIIIKDFNLITK